MADTSAPDVYEKAPVTPQSPTKEEVFSTNKTSAIAEPNKPGQAKSPRSPQAKHRCIGNVCIGVGALLVVCSIAFSLAIPPIVNSKIDSSMFFCSSSDLTKDAFTDRYGDCSDCNPFYFNLFFFNVSNAEAYLQGSKMQVTETGPYSYRRREIRVNASMDAEGWMTYQQYSYHTFDKEHSCASCSDSDVIMSWDVGYLNVMAQAGGEKGFLRRLINGTMWGPALTAAEQDQLIATNGTQLMKWVNGLNSYDPAAMQAMAGSVTKFLTMGMSAISDLQLSGFAYNGLFHLRPVSDYALGYPSLLAGVALGTNYINVCQTGMNDKCKTCQGADCVKIAGECKRCHLGGQVVANNDATCARLEAKFAAKLGATAAASMVKATCGALCKGLGLCAAPLPGYAESSGIDFSTAAPPQEVLLTQTYVENSGCHDKSLTNEYRMYNGLSATPLWVNVGSRRNPTLEEINNLGTYATCTNSPANMTCSKVFGNDGTAIAPLGAGFKGFPSEVTEESTMLYVSNSYQNVTMYNTHEVVDDLEGIQLTRFTPDRHLLSEVPWQDYKGTGYPVDGVQPLAFTLGFLSYMSYPFYFWANETLLDNVEMTMVDGTRASRDTLFEANGDLKEAIFERYATFVDIEPGTGRAMRGRKRLQASYALSPSQFSQGLAMSDVMYPNLTTEVLAPVFYGEESATAKSATISTFQGIKHLLGALLPVLIVGCVVGVVLVAVGFWYRCRKVSTPLESEC